MAALRSPSTSMLASKSYLLGAAADRRYRCEREFLLAEPIFDCRMWQRGANWHWQVMNDEHVLASGVAESHLEARNAVVLQCLQRLGTISDQSIK
jgi:hypothetical protein